MAAPHNGHGRLDGDAARSLYRRVIEVLLVLLAIVISLGLTTAAAAYALRRADQELIDAETASRLHADYSKDPRRPLLQPLDPGIIDAAAQDDAAIAAPPASFPETVPVASVPDEEPAAGPTDEDAATATARPSATAALLPPRPTNTAAAPTNTSSPLPTSTHTAVPTRTRTPLPTNTRTPAPTATRTTVPTRTATPAPTATRTVQPTATRTAASTATATLVPVNTPTAASTSTPPPTTGTPVPTTPPAPTATPPKPTETAKPTSTLAPGATVTPPATTEPTAAPTVTPTPTKTPTATITLTPTPTPTQTFTQTPTPTPTPTGPGMSLIVYADDSASDLAPCDMQGNNRTCTVPRDSVFSVVVYTDAAPAGGFTAYQAHLTLNSGNLTLEDQPNPDENLWPPCDPALFLEDTSVLGEYEVTCGSGGGSNIIYNGNLAVVRFRCVGANGQIQLQAGASTDTSLYIQAGTPSTVFLTHGDRAFIDCVAPTATPANTATLTPTPTPVPPPPATVFVSPEDLTTAIGNVSLTVDVEDVDDLGSYDLVVTWDPLVLTLGSITNGAFLGSTGRSVTCPPLVLGADTLSFGCATSGAQSGASGAGTLATLLFTALIPGSSTIELPGVVLRDTEGELIDITTVGGKVDVTP